MPERNPPILVVGAADRTSRICHLLEKRRIEFRRVADVHAAHEAIRDLRCRLVVMEDAPTADFTRHLKAPADESDHASERMLIGLNPADNTAPETAEKSGQSFDLFFGAEIPDSTIVDIIEALDCGLHRSVQDQSRLAATQRELAESRNLYTSVFENSYSVMLLIEPETGNLVDANPAAEHFYGWSREQLRQLNIAEINTLSPESIRKEMEAARKAKRNHFHFRHRRADGSVCDVEVLSGPILVEGRELLYSIVHDATARVEAEKALRKSVENFRTLVESAPDAIFIQTDLKFTYANMEACRVFGAESPRQLEGLAFPERVHPKHRGLIHERVDKVEQEGTRQPLIEVDYLRLDHTIVPVEVACAPIEYEGRTSTLVFARDISERRRAMERLRLAETVFNSTGNGIIITDARGNIIAVNPAFTEITGYQESEVLGQNPRLLQSGHQDESFYAHMWNTLLEEGQWRGELWNRRKDGATYPQYTRINMVGDDQDRPTHFVAIFTDLSELKKTEEALEQTYYHDLLTGLANRQLFKFRLERALSSAGPGKQAVCVLFIDLDGFKHINESLGLKIGDQVLAETARRIQRHIGADQLAARFGADEFALLVRGENQAAATAEAVIDSLATPFSMEGQSLFLTASGGMASCTAPGCESEELLQYSATAAGQAKAEGGNTFRLYKKRHDTYARDRVLLAAQLRRAIENRELVIHYQPLVELSPGRVCGLEALVRWQHPEEGMIAPDRFIPIAEDTGLIVPLGEYVLHEACRQARQWQHEDVPFGHLTVNISGAQVQRSDLVKTVSAILDECQFRPEYLELELTESFVMHRRETASKLLEQLNELGIRLAMDDFGTGYSSLIYLKELPFDTIKIDRFFTANLLSDPKDAAICRAIITMSNELGFSTLAEGIETSEQRQRLVALGCEYGQGYLFSKPVPAESVPDMIARINQDIGAFH